MSYLSIDYLIVYTFLIISVIIGIRAGKNIKDIREYAIGNKSFTTAALVLTLLATNFAGASVMNTTRYIFSSGIITTASLLSVGASFVLSGLLLIPKFVQFNDCLTLGDLMKKFYGSLAGTIAGLLGLINAVLLLGMELNILGIMGESLLDIPAAWSITVGGLLLALYTAYGGIRAVIQTDIFQFVTLAIFLPISRVMGLQTNQKDFYLAFFATIVAFAISKVTLLEAYDHFSILIGLATNGLFLFGSYWISHKGASIITKKG